MRISPAKSPSRPLPIRTDYVQSKDGTEIAYHVSLGAPADAPTIVIANGMGGPIGAWREQFDYLGDRYRFVLWDYRGLYASKRPSHDTLDSYRIERHLEDFEAVARAAEVRDAMVMGWSLGVQIALEIARIYPELAESLVLFNGTFGRPLLTLGPAVHARRPGIERLAAIMQRGHRIATHANRLSMNWTVVRLARRLGFMAQGINDAALLELSSGFGSVDMDVMLKHLRALHEHDAEDFLPQIRVPTLVIVGERDFFTSVALSKLMADEIPDCDLLVVPKSTHYTMAEFPDLVNVELERFFERTRKPRPNSHAASGTTLK